MCVSFFFNDTATTEIYTLSLHDALPISASATQNVLTGFGTPARTQAHLECQRRKALYQRGAFDARAFGGLGNHRGITLRLRSEEHTSELQSRPHLVCRLLLEKKNSAAAI